MTKRIQIIPMVWMVWIAVVVGLVLLCPPAFCAEKDLSQIHIGVLAKRGAELCMKKWGATADYLTQEIPGYAFSIVPLDFEEIFPTVERGEVDFILVNSALYVAIEYSYNAKRIATLVNLRLGQGYTEFSGVIFTRADRADIERSADLRGKSFMAVDKHSFGGWHMAWRKFKENGLDPHSDFADLRFGGTHDAVVYAIRDGRVDAGSVQSGTLEQMASEGKIHLNDFRVLDAHGGVDKFSLLHSTRHYPEWPFAKLEGTSDELAQRVAIALFRMSPDSSAAQAARCLGWTIPSNYQTVKECLQTIRVKPFEDYAKVTFGQAFHQYWIPMFFLLGLVLVSLILGTYAAWSKRQIVTSARTIQQNEIKFRTLFESSNDALMLLDNKGFFDCNSMTLKMFACASKEEFCSKHPIDLSPPIQPNGADSMTLSNKQIETAMKEGSNTFKWIYRRMDGKDFPAEVLLSSMELDGQWVLQAVVHDITKRKQAEDALINAEQEKATILSSISELVIYIDSDRKILWANKAALEAFKKTAGELRSACLCEYICKGKNGCDNNDCPLKRIPETKRMEEIEQVSDDSKIWAMKCYPVHSDTNGGAVVIAQDITEQKESESELLRVYTAVGEALEAIIITDLEGHATYINRAFTDVLGYTLEDLKKKTIFSIYVNDEEKSKLLKLQSEDKWKGWQWKTHARKSDGTIIPALIRSTPIPDKNDLPVEMLFIITDLTQHEEEEKEHKQLELQLIQAQKLESIGQLAAGIAHEINTPTQFVGDNTNFLRDSFNSIVRIIDAYNELLDAEKKGSVSPEQLSEIEKILEEEDLDYLKEEIPEAISQSLNGIKRISEIVLAMKEFSHPKVDEKKATDINKAIENTLTVSRNEWKYVAETETELTKDSPMVQCFPGELNQVLLNMFVNAAHTIADANKKIKRDKGLITIKTERSGKSFKISISDTGMGIPDEIKPKIFDMFFTTKVVGKGTGQGLALAYDVIVNKHNGLLTFDTELGKGSTFHIELPLEGK